MSVDLKAIKERLAKATPGPWRQGVDLNAGEVGAVKAPDDKPVLHAPAAYYNDGDDAVSSVPVRPFAENEANLDLVAHAPSDLSALLSEVESLRALLLRYGQHEQGCHFSRIDHEDGRVEWVRPCTCGLASAIREE